MHSRFKSSYGFIMLCLLSIMTSQANGTPNVENFVLLDHQGDAHELYYHQGARAIVLMTQSNQCAVNKNDVAAFTQWSKTTTNGANDLADDGAVVFFMLNASADRQAIAREAELLDIPVPILADETQLISEALNLHRSGEVLVIDPSSWQVLYRGAISGAQRTVAALFNETPATIQPEPVEGCEIAFTQADPAAHQQISYSREIAPILQEKCVVCHTEGGLGPWAMTDYNMIRGFAPMIREVLRTKRMPPWHADPHIGYWKNDGSLSSEQIQTLVHWIEAGAPRGQGPDPLASEQVAAPDWPLGQPDLILDIPAFTVPASGVVNYQFPTVKNPLDHGVWVRAATVVPGDREVVHHILAGTQDADTSELRRDSGVFDNYLIGYAPGNESNTFPSGTGVYIPPGGEYLFQLHYTPVGRETTDRSRIGLYFYDEPPANFYRQSVVINPTITIPANTARHAEVAYYEFDKPALLHDLVPHAHYRGVASKFELVTAQGTRETILRVKRSSACRTMISTGNALTYLPNRSKSPRVRGWCIPLGTTTLPPILAILIQSVRYLGAYNLGTKCSTEPLATLMKQRRQPSPFTMPSDRRPSSSWVF